jgi:hypothetical protein
MPEFMVKDLFEALHGSPTVKREIVNLLLLHDRKNQDYSGGGDPFINFIFTARELGVTPAQVFNFYRAIKTSRLRTLTPDVTAATGESRLDTLRDLALYCLLEIGFATEHTDLYNTVLSAFDVHEEFSNV